MMHRFCAAILFGATLLSAQLPDFRPPSPLFGAVLRNDTKTIKELLAAGAKPDEHKFFGLPALIMTAMQGNREAAVAMLEAGADPKSVDRYGSTALMFAAGGERPDAALVDELVRRGVDPNTVNRLGETALTWAARRGDHDMVARLKDAGASDATAIKSSVERAVASLQKSGPQFIKVSGCTSCHHQSLPQMVYGAARKRGYAVDAATAEKEMKMMLAVLKPMKEPIAKGLDLPSPGITLSYALMGMHSEGYGQDEYTDVMVKAIKRTQLPDGRFPILPFRPPMEASSITGTALSIRAMKLYDRDGAEATRRAQQWLLQTEPVSTEEVNMKLLGLAWSGADRKAIEKAAAAVMANQRQDGGWGQLPGIESDAYATGQSMFALQEAGVAASKHALARGTSYLLRTQLPDGTWHVRTRSNPVQELKESGFPHGRDQWISAAGTSWAALALANTQPELPVLTQVTQVTQ